MTSTKENLRIGVILSIFVVYLMPSRFQMRVNSKESIAQTLVFMPLILGSALKFPPAPQAKQKGASHASAFGNRLRGRANTFMISGD
ncbi:MAG: hypothetical protein LBG29_10040 [Synergistaceae bacterium]|jgi:hypothetical protein|nr:hypothetical protein [Synergistaceae bacterium]